MSWGSRCISASAPSEVAREQQCLAQHLVREHRVGLQFERLPKRRDRVGVPAEYHVREAEITPGVTVHRVAAHQFLEDGDRAPAVSCRQRQAAAAARTVSSCAESDKARFSRRAVSGRFMS